MPDLDEHRTPEQEVIKASSNSGKRKSVSTGLAKYFQTALEHLNYLEYGDPSEYILRKNKVEVFNSPLESIWVPPRFRRQDQSGDEVPFDTLLNDSDQGQLVLADPGCGKSTLSRYLTCLFIKNFQQKKQNYFGILVPLSLIQLSGKTYQEAVAHCAAKYVGLEKDNDVIDDLKKNISHACIIFDGFDELPISRKTTMEKDSASLRQEAAALIRSLLYVQIPQAESDTPYKLIITCRTKDYFEDRTSNLGTLPHYYMSKFSPDQMNLAIFRWHEAAKIQVIEHFQSDNEAIKSLDERRIGIQSTMREHSDLATVCLTPLMLNALQTVFSDVKDIPSSVSQLCWQAINWFFIDKYRDTNQDLFVKQNGTWLLETITEIGWSVQARVVTGQLKAFNNIELRELTKSACTLKDFTKLDYDSQEDAITRVASFLRRGHGILVKVSDDGFDFVHNVFREVLAGRALARLSMSERRLYALNEQWQNPIRYWAGLKASENDGLYEISSFVAELSQDVQSKSLQATLACGGMLVEVIAIVPSQLITRMLKTQIDEIREKLCCLLKKENLRLVDRIKIGDMLGTLGDPRLEKGVLDRIIWIAADNYQIGRIENHRTRILKYQKCPAAPPLSGQLEKFGISSYLVTNAEFQRFIEAGGYEIDKYWCNETALKWARGDEETIQILIKKASDVAQIHYSSELAAQRLVPDEIPERCIQMIKRKLPLYWDDPANNRPNQPIVGLNWWEAIAYCRWLEETLKKKGLLEPQKTIRLPIEAEWEIAARLCGENNIYPWIDGEPSDCALVRVAFTKEDIAPLFRSCGVGLFRSVKTKFSIYDLVGNVWEWSASKAHPYDKQSFVQTLDTAAFEDRISRGSSWLSSEEESTQITFRSFDPPYNAYEDLGFRIVIK